MRCCWDGMMRVRPVLVLLLLACCSACQPLDLVSGMQGHLGVAHGRSLLVNADGALQSAESCIASQLAQLSLSCSALRRGPGRRQGDPAQPDTRDALIRVLQQCLSSNSSASAPVSRAPMRYLTPTSVFAFIMKQLTQTYADMTRVNIDFDLPAFPDWLTLAPASIANAANPNRSATHDAWSVISGFISVGVQAGAFQSLTDLVTNDRRLNWEGVLPVLRTSGVMYKSEARGRIGELTSGSCSIHACRSLAVIAIPTGTTPMSIVYRKDIFEQYNLTLPRTWRELLDFARQYNGTAGMYGFCGMQDTCSYLDLILLQSIFASQTQTKGPTQGWLFEPNSMRLLMESPAMLESLAIVQGLRDVSAPFSSTQLGCVFYPREFALGKCLIAPVMSAFYKAMSHTSRLDTMWRVQGNIGFLRWPGTDRVLDADTNTLVPCDPDRCPYATRHTTANGSAVLVNAAPYVDLSSIAINAYSPPDLRFFMYQVLSYLSSEAVSNQFLFYPDSESGPTRMSQLNPKLWAAAGFNANDSKAYCDDVTASISHPNFYLAPRMPGSYVVTYALSGMLEQLTNNVPLGQIVAFGAATVRAALLQTYGNNETALKLEYWGSLNRRYSSPQAPAMQPPAPGGANPAQFVGDGSGLQPGLVSVCVVVPVLALSVLTAWLYRRLRRQKAELGHPGSGPATTLCVTDIQCSTLLWEALDELVMDTSLKLQNACIRGLAAKHGGYESVWEGDSFIIAFHHPSAAVAFCMAVQQQLLHMPWPAELLQSAHANEVWCREVKLRPVASRTAPSLNSFIASVPSEKSLRPKSGSSLTRFGNPAFEDSMTSQGSGALEPVGAAGTAGASRSMDKSFAKRVIMLRQESEGGALGTDRKLAPTSEDYPTFDETASEDSPVNVGSYLQAQWRVCEASSPEAVLAWRGLRVRMGLHAALDTATSVTFNTVMQRYHYTGPIRVVSNAVTSAGHGGYTLMSTSTAALLDSDGSGVLKDLPDDCGVYYMGKHVLSGAGEPLDLLLVLSESLRCRLALQQADLRSQAVKVPGILTAPAPSPAASDSTALAFVQFSGLSTLMAWDAEETSKAIRLASACISDVLASCQGTLSEDGLTPMLKAAGAKQSLTSGAAFPDATAKGKVVCAFAAGASADADTHKPAAVSFALALHTRLLMEDWSEKLLQHELAEPVGTVQTGTAAYVSIMHAEDWSQHGSSNDGSYHRRRSSGLNSAQSPRQLMLSPFHTSKQSADGISTVPADGHTPRDNSPTKRHQEPSSATSGPLLRSTGTLDLSILRGSSKTAPGPHHSPSRRGTVSFQDHVEYSPGSKTNVAKALLQKRKVKYIALDVAGLRGLRFKIVVTVANQANFTVAKRSSGRAVYSGESVKKALKELSRAKLGQIVVHKELMAI